MSKTQGKIEYLQELTRQRDAEGLCRWCGSEAEPGHRHCAEHLAYYRKRQEARRARLRREGKCVSCGHARPCRCTSETYRERQRERSRRRREERLRDGVCTGCGGDREDESYVRCELCREHERESAA